MNPNKLNTVCTIFEHWDEMPDTCKSYLAGYAEALEMRIDIGGGNHVENSNV